MKDHAKTYFNRLLKLKIEQAQSKGRKYRPPRFKKPRRPLNIEREYTKDLDQMVKYLRKLYEEDVYPKLPAIIDKANAHKKDSFKKDTYADDVDHMMSHVQIQFQQKFSKPVKASIARNIGMQVNKFSKGVFEDQVNTLVGTNVFVAEPWLEEKMSAFVKENVDLVSKWSDSLKAQAEEIIMRGVRTGSNVETIEDELRDRIDVVESRYDMIARDQVNKLNGQLSQARHEDLGIDKYTWDTSHDDRVRPMHAALDGEVFAYDDPPVTNEEGDTNNPGEDYQCIPEGSSVQIFSPTKKAFRRWFTGELTTIITGANPPLRVTRNHPVLTHRGWLQAHLVKMGDYLIEAPNEGANRFITNPKRRNSSAKEVFGSLKSMGISKRIAGRASWFHGDATAQQVDIVEVDRELFFNKMTLGNKKIKNDLFTLSNSSTFCHREKPSGSITFWNPNSCKMRLLNLVSSFFKRHLRPFYRLCFALRPNFNFIGDKNSSNWAPTDFEMMGDSFLAHSISIHPDDFVFRKVESVFMESWSGWVHNFETISGWYGSSNLIVHNCRCADIPYVDEIVGELSDEIDEEDQAAFEAEQEDGDEEE